jgi:hypothetical protein
MTMGFVEAVEMMQHAVSETFGVDGDPAKAFTITLEERALDSLFVDSITAESDRKGRLPTEIEILGTKIRRAETWEHTAAKLASSLSSFQVSDVLSVPALDAFRGAGKAP